MAREVAAVQSRAEQQSEAYAVACKMVSSWPSWKRDIVDKNTRLTPELKVALSRRDK